MAAEFSPVVLVCLIAASVFAAPKPSGSVISPCSLKDPALDGCMLTQAKAIWPRMISGVREWGLPPLDPLFVTKMELHNSGNKAVNLEMAGYNLTFAGYKDIQMESLKFNPKSLHLEVVVTVPTFSGTGHYKTHGQIIVLPISGEGFMTFVHEKHFAKISLDFKRTEKRGKMFMKLDKARYEIKSVAKLKTRMDNLFGNKQLSDNMNKIMNENGQAVFQELKPSVDGAFSDLTMALLAPMFDRVPLNELFKDTDTLA